MDLFVAPTIGFDLLYVLIIIRLERRNLVWINVTLHPTAEWIARQITEAFPWNEAPQNLIRDRDRVYGAAVTHRLQAMGIRDKPIALALAEWLRRKIDRIDPTRVRRPYGCVERSALILNCGKLDSSSPTPALGAAGDRWHPKFPSKIDARPL